MASSKTKTKTKAKTSATPKSKTSAAAATSPAQPKQVSQSPTRPPVAREVAAGFDVSRLYEGAATVDASAGGAAQAFGVGLDDKMRQAYYWIVNHAIITPYYDVEFHTTAPPTFHFGGAGTDIRLPTDQSWSSFVLLPLLTFAARRRCLFIGGPGRGKTASAVLMGILAGYSLAEVRKGIQKGQPQMTIADLWATRCRATWWRPSRWMTSASRGGVG